MGATATRRLRSVPALFVAAFALALLSPLWFPVAAVADLVRGRPRLPTVRLLAFGLAWSWLESAGVLVAAWLWATRRAHDHSAQYALQRWWAARLIGALGATTGIRVEHTDTDAMRPGPVVVFCRHASLADSLLSAWVITTVARMQPRYVLKRELLLDPCLDIVGNRLPNHFLDREAPDSSVELQSLTILAADMGPDDAAIIFPEGTRANPAKRGRALDRIRERDPQRADRLGPMLHLLPPRPAGSAALLRGNPAADVVLAWHVGFDGLDTFGGILRHLARPPRPVRFHTRRVERGTIPDPDAEQGEAFTRWLDDAWLSVDAEVHRLLTDPQRGS